MSSGWMPIMRWVGEDVFGRGAGIGEIGAGGDAGRRYGGDGEGGFWRGGGRGEG